MAADASVPAWATAGAIFSVTRTSDELSIVAEESLVPAGVTSQAGWRAFKVHGPFVLMEVGVLASLAAPLVEADVSVFVISTFDTDYLFISDSQLSAATAALLRAGHKVLATPSIS
jgi:hypothetical protein